MAIFRIRMAQKRVIAGDPLNLQLVLGLPHLPPAAALPPLAGAHTCEGADLGSPASSLREGFNQYLPALKGSALLHKAVGQKGRRARIWLPLWQPCQAEQQAARAAQVLGALTGQLCSPRCVGLPSRNAESIPRPGTKACSEGSQER